jgi:TonB-dependent receptor
VANQLDIGVEYYLSEDQALTVSTFFKDLESHIGSSTDKLTLNGVTYDFTGPVNGDGGQIKGFEMMYQQAFKNLPAPFDGLGFYANYSYTDSNVYEFVPKDNPLPLGGLSKDVANLTLWYYKAGFDAKVSYNYRSGFTRVGSWTPSEINSIDAETTLDASVSYEVNSQLKLMLQGQNLTNEASTSYFDNDPSRIGSYLDWGRRFLIGFSYSM